MPRGNNQSTGRSTHRWHSALDWIQSSPFSGLTVHFVEVCDFYFVRWYLYVQAGVVAGGVVLVDVVVVPVDVVDVLGLDVAMSLMTYQARLS